MQCKTIKGVRIQAISSAIPEQTLDLNFFAAQYGEKEAARVIRGTGITAVRYAKDISNQNLIVAAAKNLLEQENISLNDIDALVVVTQTPDQFSPGAAFGVHAMLGLSEQCYLSSINDGCAGYVNGLIQAAALIKSGVYERVLLCTGDINSRLIDDNDYQLRMLFGDAASATLICLGKEEDELSFITGVDGSGKDMLGVKLSYEKNITYKNLTVGSISALQMDGVAVMSFALRRVPEIINMLLAEKSINKEDIDLFALHQPNEFMLNYLRKILDVDSQKLPSDVKEIGNTNSTSIPLLLTRITNSSKQSDCNETTDYHSNHLSSVILCGFGVGLAWNALHVNLSSTRLIPPVIV